MNTRVFLFITFFSNAYSMETSLDDSPMSPRRRGQIVESPVRLVSRISNMQRQLLAAARRGTASDMQSLIERLSDKNALMVLDKKFHQYSLLHWAVDRKDIAMTKLLLHECPELQSLAMIRGHAPIHLAAINEDTAMLQAIVDMCPLQANTKSGWLGNTPLHYSAESGDWVSVECLVDKGADIHAENALGLTPFGLASARFKRSGLASDLLVVRAMMKKEKKL